MYAHVFGIMTSSIQINDRALLVYKTSSAVCFSVKMCSSFIFSYWSGEVATDKNQYIWLLSNFH